MTALQRATTPVVARNGEAEYVANEWTEGGSLTALGRHQADADGWVCTRWGGQT
jgi:hypothetical protein